MLPESEPLWRGLDFFGPQCPLPPRVYERNAPPPPPPHPHHHTTSPHCSPPPLPTARLKWSPSASISDFWPPSPLSHSRLRTPRPPPTPTPPTPLHYLPPPTSMPISDGAPEIEPERLDFGFLA